MSTWARPPRGLECRAGMRLSNCRIFEDLILWKLSVLIFLVTRVDARVVLIELGARRRYRKLPVDFDRLGASLFEECEHFCLKTLNGRDASIQALARDH